jgi:hypothetical protein
MCDDDGQKASMRLCLMDRCTAGWMKDRALPANTNATLTAGAVEISP